VPSWKAEGALGGGKIAGVRYAGGSVLIRIHDFEVEDGFSTF
jgi:hypothetical protein